MRAGLAVQTEGLAAASWRCSDGSDFQGEEAGNLIAWVPKALSARSARDQLYPAEQRRSSDC